MNIKIHISKPDTNGMSILKVIDNVTGETLETFDYDPNDIQSAHNITKQSKHITMSNIENQHKDKIDCPEHAEQVKQQITGGASTSHEEYSEEEIRAQRKAGTTIYNRLVSVHGKAKAEQIIREQEQRAIRQRLNSRSVLQSAVLQGMYGENNMFKK